ncbi:hypothetical protein H0I76_13580 [Limibaculum sp. M0105]|uniref:Uncharacterized protein n=1 Tax=Thermohalobaculum xanthum TaxID=2753746 RepID=A0A8J7MA23_9RHOB|nr:hypothetical protein [Thermohalobaculum xanthum]MBK0400224.1 hypothetical protein [Thermohalobaculum xanthum]
MSIGSTVTLIVFVALIVAVILLVRRQRDEARQRRLSQTHSNAWRGGGHDEQARIRDGGMGNHGLEK